ncbi:MAG TPA: hypothetical protein VNI01_00830 [Elusimicrobiota bacterium]|jgi:hypothetical protein|nr:hypothetical protein [Elusimicrobiota bacterium]
MKTKNSLALGLVLLAGAAAASDQSSVGVSPAPKAIQMVGTTDVWYEPTRYPNFANPVADNMACGIHLVNDVSGTYRVPAPPTPLNVLSKTISFSNLGLGSYRKTASIMVSFTLRAEAYQSAPINPWTNNPRLCSPWHGSIDSVFPGGDVVSMLYVNNTKFGRDFSMTFPPLGAGSTTNVSDPTITGSVTLKPSDFGGQFPDSMTFDVRWQNLTVGARAKTPAYMRNMTIFITPVTQ